MDEPEREGAWPVNIHPPSSRAQRSDLTGLRRKTGMPPSLGEDARPASHAGEIASFAGYGELAMTGSGSPVVEPERKRGSPTALG